MYIFECIYQVVRQIPPGRVTTYGAVANYLGTKGGARVVGYAMNASHSETKYVPAHRVVNRKGVLTGKHHFPNKATMQELLEAEGIVVKEDQIVDFVSVFWDPEQADSL